MQQISLDLLNQSELYCRNFLLWGRKTEHTGNQFVRQYILLPQFNRHGYNVCKKSYFRSVYENV